MHRPWRTIVKLEDVGKNVPGFIRIRGTFTVDNEPTDMFVSQVVAPISHCIFLFLFQRKTKQVSSKLKGIGDSHSMVFEIKKPLIAA